jgi:glycosyltransferase involved in cell wall biosynthesis
VVEALAVDLLAVGDEVAVAATTRDGPIGQALRRAGVPVEIFGIASPFDARTPFRLAGFARRFGAEVIHSHLAVSDIAVALASPLLGRTRLVTTVHNTGVELTRAKRWPWIAALHRFDRILAVSDAVAKRLRRFSALLRPEIAHPSLVEVRPPTLSREEARARLGLAATDRVVMAIGRLMPIKGFDVLAEAAERLDGAKVILIGEGPERDRLAASRIRLTGERDDASELLVGADVVVCPSRSEGFPQVPLQAMAAARAVVATNVPGLTEIVVPGETGSLVEPEDPSALASALREILADPVRATQMGHAGRERLIHAGLTRRTMVEQVRAVYRGI